MRRAVFGIKLKKENEFFMLYGSQNIVGRHGAYTLLAGCAQGRVFPCCLGNRTLASVSLILTQRCSTMPLWFLGLVILLRGGAYSQGAEG